MTVGVSPDGFDGELRVNFDSLGKLYVSIAIVWTTLVICGSSFLLYNRHLPALRVRNTHLWTSAVAFLHAYWVLCLTAYVLNGTYPCTAEFWIMSLWLPFGIALNQVNGLHLLHVANLQARFINPQIPPSRQGSRSSKSHWSRFRNIGLPDSLLRIQKLCIVLGVTVQVLVTLVIYLVSRKFHPSWGVAGHAGSSLQCRRGWEWIPSIVWQLLWAWVYAPYLLWKVRKIHDLHGWRLQTTICCIAGLLGSPMWLLALYSPYYSPGLAKASRYFIPPLWFTPGIVAIEVSIILVPCIMVLKSRKLRQETLQQLLDWERNQASGTSVNTGSTCVSKFEKLPVSSPKSPSGPFRNELYSMKALEKALITNITPLLRFAALKDFSGENISFLKHVQDWKATWAKASQPPPRFFGKKPHFSHPRLDPKSLHRHQFALAVEIYTTFVSSRYSDFPINISCPQYKDLESVFSDAASTLNANIQENTATPFDCAHYPQKTPPDSDLEHHAGSDAANPSVRSNEKDTISIASTAINTLHTSTRDSICSTSNDSTRLNALRTFSLLELKPRLGGDFEVPALFGPNVFDEAEQAVKYAVLTNTWPKFVMAGSASASASAAAAGSKRRGKEEDAGSGDSSGSNGGGEKWIGAGALAVAWKRLCGAWPGAVRGGTEK